MATLGINFEASCHRSFVQIRILPWGCMCAVSGQALPASKRRQCRAFLQNFAYMVRVVLLGITLQTCGVVAAASSGCCMEVHIG